MSLTTLKLSRNQGWVRDFISALLAWQCSWWGDSWEHYQNLTDIPPAKSVPPLPFLPVQTPQYIFSFKPPKWVLHERDCNWYIHVCFLRVLVSLFLCQTWLLAKTVLFPSCHFSGREKLLSFLALELTKSLQNPSWPLIKGALQPSRDGGSPSCTCCSVVSSCYD